MVALFHQLHLKALMRKQETETLTGKDEDKMWISGVMSQTTRRSLQNTAIFVVWKMFSLQRGVENRKLKLSYLK